MKQGEPTFKAMVIKMLNGLEKKVVKLNADFNKEIKYLKENLSKVNSEMK